ncbi:methylated-DNA--[protein]-cysteine S-methyltransferase [Arthrobacter sp. H41]|uniref:methylated-DNA--[protein]-cysteine S-methyltransferase n=1 Tax=Arthrobacter sp. H41 TaxID=1312978 RepID=UPI0009DF9168|nr:methylated-DNA--[protein]-cysteine S-methyltransferase [Arthrobacter sp. H41]
MRYHSTLNSPIGGLIVVEEDAELVGVYHAEHSPSPASVKLGTPFALAAGGGSAHPHSAVKQAEVQLGEYFAGARKTFDVHLGITGTAFQLRVWRTVREIPYGETRSYRDIASELGNAAMGRAVGAAIRANPLSILIPGHRVVAGNGAVTGYAAGVEVKQFLLDLEGGRAAAAELPGTPGPGLTGVPPLPWLHGSAQ